MHWLWPILLWRKDTAARFPATTAIEPPSFMSSPSTEQRHAALDVWEEAEELGLGSGFRNAQVTVLAPTGTIGFMMDCDTTGIEPMLGVVVFKKMVGGGYLTLVNQAVGAALLRLGYTTEEVSAIESHIQVNSTIEGAPTLREEHLAIFDCAFRPAKGTRSIHWQGHVRMMAAVHRVDHRGV